MSVPHLDPHAPAFVCLDWDYITQSASCGRVRAEVGAGYILSLTHVPVARWVFHGVKLLGCVGIFRACILMVLQWDQVQLLRWSHCWRSTSSAEIQQAFELCLPFESICVAVCPTQRNFSFSCCLVFKDSHLNFSHSILYVFTCLFHMFDYAFESCLHLETCEYTQFTERLISVWEMATVLLCKHLWATLLRGSHLCNFLPKHHSLFASLEQICNVNSLAVAAECLLSCVSY